MALKVVGIILAITAVNVTGLPVILEGPRSGQVKLGSSAILKCRSSSSGDGRTVWTHQGAQLFSTPRTSSGDRNVIKILDDGTLVINNIGHRSEGVYACTVIDQSGSTVSRPAILSVQGRTEKPRISHRPVRTSVKVGELIVLDCLARGYPPPHYTWYKDGGQLSPAHDRFYLAQNGSLIIQNAQFDDSAHYRCSASNYLGKASSSARVQVDTSDPPAPPKITTRPRNKNVQEGGIIELTCVAQGSPYPTITWWNNRRLVIGNSRVTLSNGGQHLRIQDIEIYDQGAYTCVAENSLGREQTVSVITVVPDANPNRRGGSNLHARRGSTSHNYPTRSEVGGTAGTQWPSSPTSSRWTPTSSQGLQSRTVARGTGSPRASQALRADVSKPRDQLSDQSDIAPPTTTENHSDMDMMRATLGSTVQLQCRVQAVTGAVSWEKDGLPLQNHEHRLASDGSIFLYNLKTRDSGEYACINIRTRERRMVAHVSVIQQPVTSDQVSEEDASLTEQLASSASASAPATNHLPSNNHNQELTTTTNTPTLSSESQHHRVYPDYDAYDDAYDAYDEPRHETDLSYDVQRARAGDAFVLAAIEEARQTVDKALNHTVEILFKYQQHTARTPHQLLNIFRFPSGSDRELARAGEIYHRTLDLVEDKVREGKEYTNISTFSIVNLISPANLELIGNLSGCEAHRRHIDCEDVCFQTKYRSADGSCNNWGSPLLGASLTPFRRILRPVYENGFNSPIGQDPTRLYNGHPKPSARTLSTQLISSKQVELEMDGKYSSMLMQWGQFIDHDIGHSMESVSRETFRTGQTCGSSCENEPPCFPIPIPEGDSRITSGCMEFTRSAPACGSGATSVFFERLQTREQVNQLTSFIDASQVYGSERTLALSLRNLTNQFGRLREGITYEYGKPLLPFNDGHPIDCRRDPRESDIGCFLAGDVRANEQLGLLALHTIWFREHNRIAEQLRELNPHWLGDTLYEEARKVVGALMQHITYHHWLPLIIGEEGVKDHLGEYKGYSAGLDPSLSNVFSTAAFRFGHSLINPEIQRLNQNFTTIPEGNLALHAAFFAPWRVVEEGGIDPILRGLYHSPAKMPVPGQTMHSDLTDRLFEVAHTVALDLGALNVQRGRDHGLPAYPAWVNHCGLGNITTWRSVRTLIKDERLIGKLKQLYKHPANIDLFVGGILENIVDGGRIGPTFRCIIAEQFRRLRDGDRFWYEREGVFTPDQLAQLKQASLTSIICNNADDIRRVSANVFVKGDNSALLHCAKLHQMSLLPWKECVRDDQILLSRRVRRNTQPSTVKDTSANFSSNFDVGIEEPSVASLQETIQRLQKKVEVLEQQCSIHERGVKTKAKKKDELVCLTSSGEVKESGDHWIVHLSADRCLFCQCKVGNTLCEKSLC